MKPFAALVAFASALLMAGTSLADNTPQARNYGASIIAITFGDSFQPGPGMAATNYKVIVSGQGIGVAKVGRDSKIQRFIQEGWPYKPVMQHTVFLVLQKPLKEGDSYTVALAPAVLGEAAQVQGKFSSELPAPDVIKINQCGYLSDDSRKLAYLGGYLGDLGSFPPEGFGGKFRVIDLKSNKPAFEGVATLSIANDKESGENVYWLDFSALKTPGRYAIEVEGLGRSYPFAIGEDAFEQALVTAVHGIYQQRCGIALVEPYTKWTHEACHRMPAKLVTYYDSMDGAAMKNLPTKLDPSGKTVDGWGGWHDAGDYDRLLGRHIETIGTLLDTYEANPTHFADAQDNIPESGNKIPDILDEAKWGLDWMERMYDPSDGAFYYRVETVDFGWNMPDKDKQQLYCMAKYPYYSALAGVPFARAARNFRPFDAKLADHYLEIAKSALKYGQQHLKADERMPRAIALLAAEIYCTTGDAEAHKLFLASRNRDSLTYALCQRADVDKAAQQEARQAFIRPAEELLARQRKQGYVSCMPRNHGGTAAFLDADIFLRGYQASGQEAFRQAAQIELDCAFGCNPLGYSWVTGIGSKYPKSICHHPSVFDGIDEPVPGIPVNGPRKMSVGDGSANYKVFAERFYPAVDQYPVMRHYSELPQLPGISEFTHAEQAGVVFAISFFTPAVTK